MTPKRKGSISFDAFLRSKRLEKQIGLREFAKLIDMQPSNYCSIESGSQPAPIPQKLENIAKVLQLTAEEKRNLYDLAANTRDEIPADLQRFITNNTVVPMLLRTVEDEEVGPDQINAIIEDIKSGRYRKPKDQTV